MKIEIQPNGVWYHGSDKIFSMLGEGSSITQWRELAEAFSHKPSSLSYEDDGRIAHNGEKKGYLYVIDEPIEMGKDVYPHPGSTMDENAEFLTKRPLKVKRVSELPLQSDCAPADRNEKILSWIIKRVTEEYADDVDMVLAYGSAINGTAHEKSDVDCYFIPGTERGYGFGADFILEGVGYDIFPMSWERVENIADMNEVLLPCVGDVRILYARTEEEEKRFAGLQERLASHLTDAAYTERKAEERFAFACSLYGQMLSFDGLADVRTCAGYLIMALADAAAFHNHDYYHFGLKRQYEDLKRFPKKPDDFMENYLSVIRAQDGEQARRCCLRMLKSVSEYMGWKLSIEETPEEVMSETSVKEPDYAGLAVLYEEISSTFQKIYVSCEKKDQVLAFLSAVCLQYELQEASQENGLPDYDILSSYTYDNLPRLAERTKQVEEQFVRMIEEGGGRIRRFADFEELERAEV